MRNDCKIVQDLLPNYIEKVTSKETNEYIEEHLKQCLECSNIYNSMKDELNEKNNNSEKEINYLKKLKSKIKVWKLFLTMVIILVFMFLSVFLYRVCVITKLYNLGERNENLTNYYYLEEREGYTTEVWKKNSITKIYIKHTDNDFSATMWEDTNTGEHYNVIHSTKQYTTNKPISYNFPESFIYSMNIYYNYGEEPIKYSESLLNRIKLSFDTSISKIHYDGKECYILDHGKQIVEKDTGFLLQDCYDDNLKTNYSYKINNVTDKDIERPDLTGYTLIEH